MKRQKLLCLKNYFYLGVVFLLLVWFLSAEAAQGENSTKHKRSAAPIESKQQPSPLVSPVAIPSAVQQSERSSDAQKGEPPAKGAFWDVKLTDWIQVGINAVLLLVVFWQAKINRDQRITMHKQNEIMEGQNRIMQGELDVTRDNLKQSDRALLASEAQAEAAKQSVLIAKESFYVGERPYFGIAEIGLEFINQRTPRISIVFENGGRTPAWHFHVLLTVVLGSDPNSESRWEMNTREPAYPFRYFGVGQKRTFVFLRPDLHYTSQQTYDIQEGHLRLFAVGAAHYTDMRGERLHYDFTALWDPKNACFIDWEVKSTNKISDLTTDRTES